MKITLQVMTATLGDVIIEESDDKTTTNPADQRDTITRLLQSATGKIAAVYKIPTELFNPEDPRVRTRLLRSEKQRRFRRANTGYSQNEQDEEDRLIISPDELPSVIKFIKELRKNNV